MATLEFSDYLAICDTKARYCRSLDEKRWDDYGDCFTEDVLLDTSGSGGPRIEGRPALLETIRGAIGDAITVHQVHSPEITLLDADTAEVIWAMQDRVIWSEEKARAIGKRSLTGFGHYRERYVRGQDGRWRIARSALTRLHIDFEPWDA